MIFIVNDGPRIVRTTYWQTEHARRGLLYVSVNARAFRLLVPDAARVVVHEMQAARANYAIVTRGPWRGQDALEILLEDGSDSPYAVHVLAAQCDRLPAPQDAGRTDLRLLVYTPAGLACEFPARYRLAPVLPCLAPWSAADTPGLGR